MRALPMSSSGAHFVLMPHSRRPSCLHRRDPQEANSSTEDDPHMNDRAFRLDFLIAMAALVVSAVAAGTAAYQTYVINQQFGASVWPYLGVSTTRGTTRGPTDLTNLESIKISNNGLGPLLMRSAQLYVDGKPIPSWNEYTNVLEHDPLWRLRAKDSTRKNSSTDVDASTIIRPGEDLPVFTIDLPKGVPLSLVLRHPITIDFCYCSLNNSCWKHHATPGVTTGEFPKPTSFCAIGPNIKTLAVAGP
jgi:hypothetical protein